MARVVDCDLLRSIEKNESNLNRKLKALCDLFSENKLSIPFGEDKTKCILFGCKNCKNLKKLDIRGNDKMIKQYSTVTYLGSILTSGNVCAVHWRLLSTMES